MHFGAFNSISAPCEISFSVTSQSHCASVVQLSRPHGDLLSLLCHSPLGMDATGATYHHLPGLPADPRVYKCLQGGSSSSSNGRVQWATQAASLQQLQAWVRQLASSSNSSEQALHAALVQQVRRCAAVGTEFALTST